VLERLDYLVGDQVTPAGRQLARVYSESDLLVVECLRGGLWNGLRPHELAAVVAALVYESRRPDEIVARVPSGRVQDALTEMERLWTRLSGVEQESSVQFLRAPDAGFSWAAWRWADGAGLDEVLQGGAELTAGDFVRWCKQLVDLLDQVADVAGAAGDAAMRSVARAAIGAVRRGVVDSSVA
jgi:ATP-dependent RNA helicase HelY